MGKRGIFVLFFLMTAPVVSQTLELPPDFRQHNLLDYNANLFSPVLSLQQEAQQRIALWTRWQWQDIDADPTTLYLSYLRNEGDLAFGAGFFQHNTGLYQQNGGVLNFAYRLPFGNDFNLAFGLNLFGYQRVLADDRFQPDDPLLPVEDEVRDFVLQMAPALEIQIRQFALGVVAENLFDYNFTQSEAVSTSDEKTFTFMARYGFPVSENAAGRQTMLQPQVYYRRIPGLDNQLGINALWSAPYYWAQAGYNSFYGFSAGAGARLFQRVSIGGLLEFGSNDSGVGGNTSYEVVLAFSFGQRRPEPPREEPREELIVQEAPTDEQQAEIAAEIEAQQRAIEAAARRQDSLDLLARQQELALQQRRDSIRQMEEAALALQQRRDSIRQIEEAALALQQRRDSIRQMEEAALALRQKQDSIRQAEAAALALKEKVVLEKGEKYQEVSREEGLQPGFYLIANVFGTKRYYDLFMKRLTDRGLEPKSFYRSANKYNYVYLGRYNSMEEARKARDSKFGGRYQGELWIFRVR